MNRSVLIAVAGAAVLVLASCSSTSGTATVSSASVTTAPTSSAPTSSAQTSSAQTSSAQTSSAPTSSAPPSSEPSSGAPTSTTPESSTPVSSATTSSSPDSSTPESSTPGSSAPASSSRTPSTPASSTSASGALDAPTTAWFGAFCGGLTPFFSDLKEVQTKEQSTPETDYAAQQKLFVGLLKTGSTQLSGIGTKLEALPAPTFKGGSAFAGKTVDVMTKAGPAFAAAAKKLAATSPTKAELTAAASTFETQLKGVAGQISAVGLLDIPDTTKRKLLQLPACATLQSTVQG